MSRPNSVGFVTDGLNGQRVIAKFTGLSASSSNTKTGGMIQNYILPEVWMNERMMGDDSAVCGDCRHSFRADDTCYLHKGSARMGLISTMKVFPAVLSINTWSFLQEDLESWFSGRAVRFGAYGEPVLLGERTVATICSIASHWTGYTHRHLEDRFQWARDYFMASCDTEEEAEGAMSRGWRVFRTLKASEEHGNGYVLCPASKEAGKLTTCDRCRLCKGASSKAKSIAIHLH